MLTVEPTLREYLEHRIDSLQEIVNQRVTAQEKATEKAFASSQLAIDKADAAMNSRLEGMNEFRAQLSAERSVFVTRELHDSTEAAMTEKIQAVERWQAKIVGALALAVVFVPAVTAAVVYLVTRR